MFQGYEHWHVLKQEVTTPELPHPQGSSLTGHPDVGQNGLLAVFNAADLGKVDVQSQEGHAAQEGQRSHGYAVVAGILVAVEDAVLLDLAGAVQVALVGDAAEDHDREQLWDGDEQREKWPRNTG